MKRPASYEYSRILGPQIRLALGLGSCYGPSTLPATEYARRFKAVINKCDICDDRLTECQDNIESKIDMLQEIDDSYESEYDRHEPRLLLCAYCVKEYLLPSYHAKKSD
ncbi:MAG TPA: hypothetical protein VH415_08565 [Nitrososphaeraceae archaeon]|jgi:hypothetical protein